MFSTSSRLSSIFSSSRPACKSFPETEEQSISLPSAPEKQPSESLQVLLLEARGSSFQFKTAMRPGFFAGESVEETSQSRCE